MPLCAASRDLDASQAKERKQAEAAFLRVAGDKDGPKIMGSYARWLEAKSGKATVAEIFNRNKDPMYHFRRAGEVAGTIPGMDRLPNFESATIPIGKLVSYALNKDHPVGGSKARRFYAALGFSASDAEEVVRQVKAALPQSNAIKGLEDGHGKRYAVDIKMVGPSGSAIVRTAWILRDGSESPSLTSIYVKES